MHTCSCSQALTAHLQIRQANAVPLFVRGYTHALKWPSRTRSAIPGCILQGQTSKAASWQTFPSCGLSQHVSDALSNPGATAKLCHAVCDAAHALQRGSSATCAQTVPALMKTQPRRLVILWLLSLEMSLWQTLSDSTSKTQKRDCKYDVKCTFEDQCECEYEL